MIGKCTVCGKEGEVREVITAKTFMEGIAGHATAKLITCESCTVTLLGAIRQAMWMIQHNLTPF